MKFRTATCTRNGRDTEPFRLINLGRFSYFAPCKLVRFRPARMRDALESMKPGERRDIDGKDWAHRPAMPDDEASPRTGTSDSIILSRRLDAIRDSRITCKPPHLLVSPAKKMSFGTLPEHVRHQRFAAGTFPRRLRAWRKRHNVSQSEAALKLNISKRTLQEWEQHRAAPRSCSRRNRKSHSCLTRLT